MHTYWQDLRYGARMLLKNPAVSAVAVVTLALGIGANTATFSIVNAVLLRPLPYQNPDRLVSLWTNIPEHGRRPNTPGNFFDLKNQNTVFENMAAFMPLTMTLTGDGEPAQMMGATTSAGYFAVVGAEPMMHLPAESLNGLMPVGSITRSIAPSGRRSGKSQMSVDVDESIASSEGSVPIAASLCQRACGFETALRAYVEAQSLWQSARGARG